MVFWIRKHSALLSVLIVLLFIRSSCLGEFSLSWPTPNPSFVQGLGYHTFLQKTGPDKAFKSGAFGCVRNNGHKFHEGVDLFPVKKSSRGYAEDTIFSAMEGKVVHINHSSQKSAYGKNIVLEHENLSPVLYSLYAHLEEISGNLSIGNKVITAQVLGKMGNTASFHIPLNRSHLHFEIGIRLSDRFDTWYNRQRFSTKNKHGNFNGFNLVGLDPLSFYAEFQKKSFKEPIEYLNRMPTVVKVQVSQRGVPFLVNQNPSLYKSSMPQDSIQSWVCSFGPFGIPLRLEPSAQPMKEPIRVVSYDENADSKTCRRLIERRNGRLYPSEQLNIYLELLFLD